MNRPGLRPPGGRDPNPGQGGLSQQEQAEEQARQMAEQERQRQMQLAEQQAAALEAEKRLRFGSGGFLDKFKYYMKEMFSDPMNYLPVVLFFAVIPGRYFTANFVPSKTDPTGFEWSNGVVPVTVTFTHMAMFAVLLFSSTSIFKVLQTK
jgi:hypothetical protein